MADAVAVWAVVVAAGSGERLGAEHPKAFVAFGEDPLIASSVAALDDHPAIDGIVLVVPDGWEERATFMADDIGAGKASIAVPGGLTRSDSVAAGVAEVPDDAAIILVHDAARPLVSAELIDRVLGGFADGADGVIPVLAIDDTVKRVDAAGRAEVLPALELDEVHRPELDGEQAERLLRRDHLVLHVPDLVGVRDLLRHDAGDAEHRPAAVHALRLGEPLEAVLVGAQAEGVEAEVAGERAVEPGRGLGPGPPERAGGGGDGDVFRLKAITANTTCSKGLTVLLQTTDAHVVASRSIGSVEWTTGRAYPSVP